MTNTIKADKVTIHLGKIPLEVYRLPDETYRLSKSSIAEAIDVKPQYVSDFRTGKSPEAFKIKDLTFQKIKVEDSRITFDSVPLALASQFWRYWDKRGNEKAGAIIDACVDESIERRVDAAFGVLRTEVERQVKMKARIDGKIIRRQLTDAIADFLKRHSDKLSDNDKRWIYKNCSDRTNKLAIGRIAKKAAEDLGCDQAQLRDFLETNELVRLTSIEDLTVRLIDLQDLHPLEAVKQSAERLLF